LTGKEHDDDRARCLGLGADGYVTKPFATKDVIIKVKEILEAQS
jgi:DNA-binding response OmpR family regulator